MEAGGATKPSRADVALGAVVFLATAVHVAYYFPRVVDNLFISLRYAENLAHGAGAVYNVGERVEGYSSPLWMLLQSLGIRLGFEGVTWTKCLGCSSLFFLEYALFRLTRDAFGVNGPFAWLPAAFCGLNSYVVNWAVLGLETPLHLALVAFTPLTVFWALAAKTGKRKTLARVSVVALGLTRPESALYVIANILGPLVDARASAERRATLKRIGVLFAPSAFALLMLLLARRGYYGYFVPNTYFVKGSAETFDLAKLEPLWGQGAGPMESLTFLGGALLLAYFGWKRALVTPALSVAACLYFTASVRVDWMPSLRHLLPVTVLTPIGWAVLADELARGSNAWMRRLAWLTVPVVISAGVWIASIDNRNSPDENRGRGWIRPKTEAKWQDTMLAYRRIEPPHVTRMGSYEMGQITQAWHVLEASSARVEDSYFIGRDIGAVGYYTGVRVYDTAGLFTLAVSHSHEWTHDHVVTDELIRDGMAHRPLAGEIYEGWELALGRNQDLLAGYRVRHGNRYAPVAFLAVGRPPPSPEEILRRYRQMVAKFPRLYHLHTLYGESVGAVVEKRLGIVEKRFAEPRI